MLPGRMAQPNRCCPPQLQEGLGTGFLPRAHLRACFLRHSLAALSSSEPAAETDKDGLRLSVDAGHHARHYCMYRISSSVATCGSEQANTGRSAARAWRKLGQCQL